MNVRLLKIKMPINSIRFADRNFFKIQSGLGIVLYRQLQQPMTLLKGHQRSAIEIPLAKVKPVKSLSKLML